MSQGKIIALDTPHNIKRRFGVGYNVFLEPIDANIMTQVQIKELACKARSAALAPERAINGIKESKDSLDKKLIFLVPYYEVGNISNFIHYFELKYP